MPAGTYGDLLTGSSVVVDAAGSVQLSLAPKTAIAIRR
jgi:hypothetical protein